MYGATTLVGNNVFSILYFNSFSLTIYYYYTIYIYIIHNIETLISSDDFNINILFVILSGVDITFIISFTFVFTSSHCFESVN